MLTVVADRTGRFDTIIGVGRGRAAGDDEELYLELVADTPRPPVPVTVRALDDAGQPFLARLAGPGVPLSHGAAMQKATVVEFSDIDGESNGILLLWRELIEDGDILLDGGRTVSGARRVKLVRQLLAAARAHS